MAELAEKSDESDGTEPDAVHAEDAEASSPEERQQTDEGGQADGEGRDEATHQDTRRQGRLR
jgi:hypothetical protein